MPQHLPVAKVILDTPLPHLDRPFDYLIPQNLDKQIQPGVKVKVRFSNRNLEGWVIERVAQSSQNRKLAEIEKVISSFVVLKKEVIALCQIVADQNLGNLNDVLRFAVPPRQAKIEKKYANKQITPKRLKTSESLSFLNQNIQSLFTSVEFPPNFQWEEYVVKTIKDFAKLEKKILILFPTITEINRFIEKIDNSEINFQILSAEQEASQRYEAFMNILSNNFDVVVGTRNAIFAPIDNLDLILIWDDSNENYYSPQSPYWNARDVAIERAKNEGVFLLSCGYNTSINTQVDINRKLFNQILISDVENFWPEITCNDSSDPIEQSKRIPSKAWNIMKNALKEGNVLVHVPRLGYASNLQCLSCKESARCQNCFGPLAVKNKNTSPECKWCNKTVVNWFCKYCKSTKYVTSVPGQVKIVEELGKSFPGVKILTSGGKSILRKVSDEKVIVVATPGAEPLSKNGYQASVVLDAFLTLARPTLSCEEEALRKWLHVCSLTKSRKLGGVVFLTLYSSNRVLQSLLKNKSDWFNKRVLDERESTLIKPKNSNLVISGQISEINEIIDDLQKREDISIIGPRIDEAKQSSVVINVQDAKEITKDLRSKIIKFSIDKKSPVRVKVNPYDID